MTADALSLAAESRRARESLLTTLGQPAFTHLRLVIAHLRVQEPAGVAPGICLLAADAFTVEPDLALPAAEAIALVEAMTTVLHQIGSPHSAGAGCLLQDWQMPRTLNAADACFALAHQRLLSIESQVDAEVLATCLHTFENDCLAISDILADSMVSGEEAGQPVQSLLNQAALRLVALLSGRDLASAGALSLSFQNGLADFDSSLRTLNTPEPARATLVAALASAGVWDSR